MDKQFTVGSRAFFSDMPDFRSKDSDILVLMDEPADFQWRREQQLRGVSTFRYKREPIAQMIQRTLDADDPLMVGKFLVPEVAAELGVSVADILPLQPLVSKLDDKHKYYAVIFNAYQANGSFTLTKEQRDEAYTEYWKARKIKQKDMDNLE